MVTKIKLYLGGYLVNLMTNNLIGVVSFGIGCANPLYPGIYSKITFVRPWITGITGV